LDNNHPTATVKSLDSRSIPEKVDAIINNLTKRKVAKPRTLKTLRSTINALFRDKLADAELNELIEQLTRCGTITVAVGKVNYELPS